MSNVLQLYIADRFTELHCKPIPNRPTTMGSIPVVDFASFGLHVTDPDAVDDVTLQPLVQEVKSALSSSGFLYLCNHGISSVTVDKLFSTARTFFELPMNIKEKMSPTTEINYGWGSHIKERLRSTHASDLVETLCYRRNKDLEGWPFDEIPSLRCDFEQLFEGCNEIAHRLLSIISLICGKERGYFQQFHKNIGFDANNTAIQAIWYHPIFNQEGNIRLKEHTDFGTLTLLFSDGIEGLEVWNNKSEMYEAVTALPGAIIVNIGDALQRWTGDQLVSTKHRVVVPSSAETRQKPRQTLTFFTNPDDDVILTCVDGSDKYPPITLDEHARIRMKQVTSR